MAQFPIFDAHPHVTNLFPIRKNISAIEGSMPAHNTLVTLEFENPRPAEGKECGRALRLEA